MAYLSDREFEEWRASSERIRVLLAERDKLAAIVRESSVLVAGAMRQGFVNAYQREALLYSFCKLADEPDEKIAMLKIDIPPKGFRFPKQ